MSIPENCTVKTVSYIRSEDASLLSFKWVNRETEMWHRNQSWLTSQGYSAAHGPHFGTDGEFDTYTRYWRSTADAQTWIAMTNELTEKCGSDTGLHRWEIINL